jgi:hypothetical protein
MCLFEREGWIMIKMNQQRVMVTSSWALAFATFIVPHTALAEPGNSYVGITSGGPIAAPDRIASDDLRDLATSAQLSSENDIISANFSLDLTISGRQKISEESDATGNAVTFVSARSTNLSIKASLPLNGTKDGDFVDFKTFGNDGKLTIGFNTYNAKFVSPFATLPDLAQFARGCIVHAGKDWVSGPQRGSLQKVDAVLDAYDASQTTIGSIPARLEAAAKATAADGDSGFGASALAYCKVGGGAKVGNANDYLRFAKEAGGNPNFSPAAWRRRYLDPQNTVFFGGEASFGYNRFSVVNRTTISTVTVDRVGFDVSARAGLILGNSGTVLMASGGFTRTYSAKDLVDVCSAPDPSGKTTCVNGQDGAPDRSETGYGAVSVRKVLLRNSVGEPILGIRPSVTYILKDKDWQFELPVYLQRNEKGGLDAGVKLIYNTGRDKIGLGAFVGTSF